MADKKIDYNALGQAVDTSWGRSSTPKTASYSVKVVLAGSERIKLSYAAIVNFTTEKQMILMKRDYAEEAGRVLAEAMKQIKARYKDICGESLSLSVVKGSESDSVEIININIHNVRRTAYFRRTCFVDLS